MLLLDERIEADGRHAQTFARVDDDRFVLIEDGVERALPVAAVERVMARFGRALEPGIALDGDAIAVGAATLRRFRFHAIVDAEGRDYLVWEAPGAEPLAAIATTATAALRHLALSFSRQTDKEPR